MLFVFLFLLRPYEDEVENNKELTNKEVHKATGALLDGLAICGGYSDAMAIFLNKLGLNNYKIASANHVWNYVKLDNNWYHLDLTWDDPKTKDNTDVLEYNFYMITTDELNNIKTNYHNYDKKIGHNR